MRPPYFRKDGDGSWLLDVKAVPGAKRDEIAGPLGARLKIRVAAPPEGGKANKAIRSLIADQVGCRTRDVELVSGETSAEKTFRIRNVEQPTIGRLEEETGEGRSGR